MNVNKFGLSSQDWQILEEKLIRPLKEQECILWVFGSRANGTYKKFSDIDFLYQEAKLLPQGLIFEIRENLEESNLPIKVDLVNIVNVAESYRESILSNRIKV